ncbi:MAG: MBG domain-containing protein [Hydrogenophaga sp.]|uniref:MBG domain-containing protein n=1 Tax=Hydrogenophaga sp. TaxID=1904254 RepID=UPI00272270C9|nr:MBG domain-containing protein [Hydrogenophaga sp.]MDO9570753.1 MBG domain-containing protein [Hydrogenophaga sp.]
MNLIHRSIWNEQTGTCVAVAENTRSAGKKMSSCTSAGTGGHFRLKVLAVSLMLACGAGVQAQPTGGVVSSGSATIGGTPGQMTITQTTPQVAINWQSFGILAGDSVQFVQPGSSSVALNRVVGSDPSSILGSLTSNGQVFLVNPNGILFGQGASVSVGGLVASTLALSDADFTANRHQFAGAGAGSVVNQGHIQAADGGYVALLGANVSNQGVVAAQLGTVALAAGNAVTLDLAGDRLLQVTVDQGSVNALVDNGGMLRADGGQVLMTTQVAGSLLANAVNNTGMVQAQTLNNVRGTILLMGGMQSGTVQVGGTLDASAPAGGHGGFVETSAAHVKVADGARVTTLASAGTTGMWLIDPFDFNVSAAGGDITGAQLSVNLDSSNVTLESSGGATGTAGDVNVDAAVTWTAATALVLNAFNDVNINQAVTGTNGSLTANAGRNVNVSAATTTTTGNLSFNAVNDVALSAATTITTGNLTAVAGNNVVVSAASTVTTGDMVFRADNDGTGPGALAGTVAITCGINCLTITTGELNIRFNPVTYASTAAEIAAYGVNLTGGGTLDAKAWVFGQGDDKMYDGTTVATVSGLMPDEAGITPAVTLGAVSNAHFDTKHVGTDKPITFETTFTNAVFDLFAPVGMAAGTYQASADITRRPLSVNAVTDTRVYNGTTSSTGTPTVLALQTGDTLNGTLTQAFASKDVMGPGGSTLVADGPYSVNDGNGGNNYTVTVNTAAGTITPAALVGSITADDKLYDGNNAAVIASRTLATVFAGDSVIYTGGTAQFNDPNAGNNKTVTGTGLSLAGADAGNYTVNSTANTTADITPAPLVVTADNQTKPYGTVFAFAGTEFTSSGLVNAETIGSATLVSSGAAASAHVAGGAPYPVVPSDATGGSFNPANYTINYVNGAMVVTPAQLVVTADNQTKSYGTLFPFTGTEFTSSGLLNADTIGSATLVSAGTPATASVAGSPYSIVASDATGGTFTPGDYTISYVNGSMVVTPAPLVVTADNQTKPYGTTFAFAGTEFTSTGLVNADTIGSATLVSAGAPAAAHVAGSPYPVVPSDATGGSFNPANYTISYVNGAMVITPAPLVVTANNQTKPYGTAFPFTGTEFTSSGLVNADTIGSATLVSAGTPATAPVAGSPYPIVPSDATGGTFTPGDYTISYVNGVMTVTPVALTLTANDATKVFGQTLTLPPSAFTAEGLVNGDTIDSVVETSPGTVASAPVVGSPYAIDITPGSAAGGTFVPSNYVTVYQPGDLTVTPVVVAPPVNVLPNTPYEGPVVTPPVNRPWAPVVVPANTPPQLLALVPPVSPPVVTVVQPVAPPVVQPMVQPAVQPVEVPPTPYLAPKRAPKQDRH